MCHDSYSGEKEIPSVAQIVKLLGPTMFKLNSENNLEYTVSILMFITQGIEVVWHLSIARTMPVF
jgi:hypothetical protein